MAYTALSTSRLLQSLMPAMDLGSSFELCFRFTNDRHILCLSFHVSAAFNPQPDSDSHHKNSSCPEYFNPNINTYASFLQDSINNKSLLHGKQLHAHLLITGLYQRVFLETKLTAMYAICGRMVDARQVFDKISQRNCFLYNMMIRGYACNGPCEEALKIYYEMRKAGIQPDKFSFPFVLKACASLSVLEEGKEIHHHIINAGLESDVFVANTLLAMYAKCRRTEVARQLFDNLPERNLISWNAMIAGYGQNGQASEALTLFHQMQHANVTPDAATLVSVLSACGTLSALQEGKDIHDYIIENRVCTEWTSQ